MLTRQRQGESNAAEHYAERERQKSSLALD